MTKQTDRIRTTISVDKEVHQIFVQMAEAGGMSVSRCMGEWLADTAEGAQFVAMKMQQAKQSPKLVMRELQAAANGAVEEMNVMLAEFTSTQLRKGAQPAHPQRDLREDAKAAPPSRSRSKAPSSNTGLNSPKSPKK